MLIYQLSILSLIIIVHQINCDQITENDKIRFKSLFNLNQKVDLTTLPNIYYSLVGLNVLHNSNLNAAFESTEKKVEFCNQLKSFIDQKDNQQLDNLFYASSSLKLLNCQFDKIKLASVLEPMLNEPTTIPNLFKIVTSLENSDKPLQSGKISKILNELLSKDESLLSAGLGLQIASKLSPTERAIFLNKIPNLVARSDEVDGKYLKFKGGLGLTVSAIKGIFDLSSAANKETGLTNLQIIKFVNYFFSRSTVQSVKGAAELLEVLKLLVNNKFHLPVIVSLYGSNVLNADNTNLVIKISNVLGLSLSRQFEVTSKLNGLTDTFKFSQVSGDSTLYAIDLFQQSKKLPAGKYTINLNVEPVKAEKNLVINNDIEFNIILQSSKVQLDSVEIGVGEKDQLVIKRESVKYPVSLKKVLESDNSQKLSIKFCVRDLDQSKDLTVQQALIYLVNEKTGKEIVFVANQDRISKVYNKDINLAYKGQDFNYQSGDYTIKLVVGDYLIPHPINWELGRVNIQFNQERITEFNWLERYQVKSEIVHQFRQPEKRPPVIISYVFTLLCLLPVLILLICWARIGLNFSKLKFSVSALLFHGSLFLIFTLYTLFFIRLNMFTTLKCLSGVLLCCFISGHYLLKSLASKSN